MIIRSPTARMIRPFLKQWLRQIMPAYLLTYPNNLAALLELAEATIELTRTTLPPIVVVMNATAPAGGAARARNIDAPSTPSRAPSAVRIRRRDRGMTLPDDGCQPVWRQ